MCARLHRNRSILLLFFSFPLRLIPGTAYQRICEFGRRIWYIHDWPSTCGYGGWTPWRNPCRRCCSGTAGSSPAPPERRDSSGVAANSTVGWRPARSPVNGTCTVVHLRSDTVRRIRISCGCARAYVNCVTVEHVTRNGPVHARSGNSHRSCHVIFLRDRSKCEI